MWDPIYFDSLHIFLNLFCLPFERRFIKPAHCPSITVTENYQHSKSGRESEFTLYANHYTDVLFFTCIKINTGNGGTADILTRQIRISTINKMNDGCVPFR